MSLDAVAQHPVALVEFPADDPEQALRFWVGVLGVDLQQREAGEGDGWQTHSGQTELGDHRRGAGPGDRFSLPYFSVPDLPAGASGHGEVQVPVVIKITHTTRLEGLDGVAVMIESSVGFSGRS